MSFPRKHRLEEAQGGHPSSSQQGGLHTFILKWGSISKFDNPDPLVRLIGEPSETYANVEGLKTKVLLDSGTQLSSITSSKARELGLEVKHLQTILDLEASGGGDVPYEGYVELNLDIPEMAKFKEDVLMLVVEDSPYGKRVPVAIKTLYIYMVLDVATREELENILRKWQRQGLGQKIAMKQNVLPTKDTPFDLDTVVGEVKITEKVVIKPFHTVRMSAQSRVRHHHKNVHILMEDREENEHELPDIAVVPCYGVLKKGLDRVPIVLKNLTCKPITLQKGRVVAEVGLANVIPHMLAPKESNPKEVIQTDPIEERVEKLFQVLDLKGLKSWSKTDQAKAKELIQEYQDIFALKDTELGHT